MARSNRTADRVQAMLNFIGGDDNLDMLLSGKAKCIVKIIPTLTELTPVVLKNRHLNPHTYFSNSCPLEEWCRHSGDRILGCLQELTVSVEEATIGCYGVIERSQYPEIHAQLPEGYYFTDIAYFQAVLGMLIEDGKLSEHGSNAFYVKFGEDVVLVCLDFVSGVWQYRSSVPEGSEFLTGSVIFSATAV